MTYMINYNMNISKPLKTYKASYEILEQINSIETNLNQKMFKNHKQRQNIFVVALYRIV